MKDFILKMFFLSILGFTAAIWAYDLHMSRDFANITRENCPVGAMMTESSETGLLGSYNVLCVQPVIIPHHKPILPFRIKPEDEPTA